LQAVEMIFFCDMHVTHIHIHTKHFRMQFYFVIKESEKLT